MARREFSGAWCGLRVELGRGIESRKFRLSCLHNCLMWLRRTGVSVSDSSQFSRYCLALVSKGWPSKQNQIWLLFHGQSSRGVCQLSAGLAAACDAICWFCLITPLACCVYFLLIYKGVCSYHQTQTLWVIKPKVWVWWQQRCIYTYYALIRVITFIILLWITSLLKTWPSNEVDRGGYNSTIQRF